MSCGAGYPKEPCPFKYEGRVTRKSCGGCRHFIPPRHILAWCGLYDRERVVCEKPISACASCPYKMEAPSSASIDWKDPVAVREYQTAWRKANPEKVAAKLAAFTEKHPDYMHNYYERNKKRIIARTNEARRRRRALESLSRENK